MNNNSHPIAARLLSLGLSLILASCGGGGGGGGSSSTGGGGGGGSGGTANLSMSVSTNTISSSATVGQAAPTGSFVVDVAGLAASQSVYLQVETTNVGISGITDSGALPDTIDVQFKDPAALGAGTYTDTIKVSVCTDTTCNVQLKNSPQNIAVTYTVTANAQALVITSLSPASAVAAGPAFLLTVNGTNFTPQTTVYWNNGGVGQTTYVSATAVTVQVPASYIATVGTASVSVYDPSIGYSTGVDFPIVAGSLSVRAMSPTTVEAGGRAFTLTILGAGFSSTSTVQWNGSARPTTVVSTGELLAQISATDIAATGTAQVTVTDPASSVGTTPSQTLTIVAVSKDATSFLMNPSHTGSVSFNNVSLPSSSTWSVDVGGTPSYALIAQGLVYVTVSVSGGSSQLVALSQTDGHVVWGPIVVAGASNAAYDSGKVFVVSSNFGNAATMIAYDAATGSQLWSALLQGQYAFSSPPTASHGIVFTAGAGSGGTVYALDEATGALLWTQGVANGDDSAPAVTADGVYVTYPCQTYALRPLTGESIWQNSTGCDGGGGATPVVANGLEYSPNGFGSYNGSVFDAETGATEGTYVSDNPGAFTATSGYFLQGGTLRGVTLSNNTVQWSFAGDGGLISSPIVVSGYVFIGSSTGNLYALDAATGQQAWQQTFANPLPSGATWGAGMPLSGLAAGDGLLVVPTGTTVTAYTLSTQP
ncbi:MAG: PQQ-binding-like beta-propeller repeat protein [Proteobacteria bacterium]|nr:PQQ-binding-like beta-propeller repeat protein [Pseudomonadota bacterium]